MYLFKAKNLKLTIKYTESDLGVRAFDENPLGCVIYSFTFVVHRSFRMTKLQDKRLGTQINDLSLDRHMKDKQTLASNNF